MPIRMVEDPNERDTNDNNPGRNSKPGGGLGNLIPLLLSLVFKYPKLLIPILIIGGIFVWKGGCGILPTPGDSQQSAFATGGNLDPNEYAKADIFNFLYEDNKSNPLPESVSLLKYCPKRLNQGAQGSCVAWSNAYSARTILYSRQTGENPDDVAFSPAYMYNQIKIDENCQGSYIIRAVELMSKRGAVPFRDFKYDPNTCSQTIPADLNDKASNFKIKGAQRLGENPNSGLTLKDILQIKHALNAGSPVAIGMMVGGSFMQDMMGKKVWFPNADDYDMSGFGGHAMTVIGYDDNLEGGALQIMNSWGPEWGEDGVAWVKYKDFVHFTREAYAYAPMGEVSQPQPDELKVEFALFNPVTKQEIALQQNGNSKFVTKEKVPQGTPFKVKIKNNIECYTYVFGQETDLSCYVLYPYTAKHSPYCGVTGTRVFPRGYNMQPDDKGTSDYIAVLISKEPIDYSQIQSIASKNKKADFYQSFMNSSLSDKFNQNIQFSTGENVSFAVDAKSNKWILAVIEVKK